MLSFGHQTSVLGGGGVQLFLSCDQQVRTNLLSC